jgi:2-oxoisovalerate dehydrogenase E1 component beta subunit
VPGVPFSHPLQDWFMVNGEKILKAIQELHSY